jgi:hypothetical protein
VEGVAGREKERKEKQMKLVFCLTISLGVSVRHSEFQWGYFFLEEAASKSALQRIFQDNKVLLASFAASSQETHKHRDVTT